MGSSSNVGYHRAPAEEQPQGVDRSRRKWLSDKRCHFAATVYSPALIELRAADAESLWQVWSAGKQSVGLLLASRER